jgi:hypothetical protein
MGGFVIWGTDLVSIETDGAFTLSGTEGSWEGISWTSMGEVQDICETFGISSALWPAFPDVYADYAEPHELTSLTLEARERCRRLRPLVLARLSELSRIQNRWLPVFIRILSDGHLFVVVG